MRRYLVLALAVHVGAFILASRMPKPVAKADASVIELREIEIAPTEAALDPAPMVRPTDPSAPRDPAASARATNDGQRVAALDPSRTNVPTQTGEVLTAPTAETAAPWSFSATGGPSAAAIGLDGHNVLLANNIAPPIGSNEGPNHGPPVTGEVDPNAGAKAMLANISASVHAADVAKGLGASGPVITQLEAVTRQSLIPVTSKGTFVVEANANGEVLAVHATGNGGDVSAWTELAEELLKSMQGRKVHVPQGWAGIRMVVAIDSHLALPSGSTSGAQFDGMGMRGDLSDIGASTHRTIHAHVVSELPL